MQIITILLSMIAIIVIPCGLLVGIFFIYKAKVAGKVIAEFYRNDGTKQSVLVSPSNKVFSHKGGKYVIEPTSSFIVRYPYGLPKWLNQPVPSFTYMADYPYPLKPELVKIKPLSKEGLTTFVAAEGSSEIVEAATNAMTITNIVKGAGGMPGSKDKMTIILFAITWIGLAGLAVLIFRLTGTLAPVVP